MKKIALLSLVGLLILVFGVVPARTSSLPKYIPGDMEIGTWDPIKRIYTLTKDINGSIEIVEDNLTLDGASHKINGMGYGIYLFQRSNVTVKNCNISDFFIAIFCSSGSSNALTNNIIENSVYGICLKSSSFNTLIDNILSNNCYGMHINSSSFNTLIDNTVSNNQFGIYLFNCNGNKTYNNNFMNNLMQVFCIDIGSDNKFFLDKIFGGNYWSNWTKPDDDNDGFVDYPYVFSSGYDALPWICQDGWKNIALVANAGSEKKVLVGEMLQTDGSGSYASDGSIESYDWDFGDGNTGSGVLVSHCYDIAGIYTVSLTVTDDDLTDTDTVEIIVQTPVEAIGELIITLKNLKFSKGIEKSLTVHLDNAINGLENHHTQGTMGKLNGFINQVEGLQKSKNLTEDQANILIAVVHRIIDSIQYLKA